MNKTIYPQKKIVTSFFSAFFKSMRNPAGVLLIFFIVTQCVMAKDRQILVTVSNPLKQSRSRETVVLQCNQLMKMLNIIDPASTRIIDRKTKKRLVAQWVDEDQNGTPDVVVFQSDFKAKEVKQFIVAPCCKAHTPCSTADKAVQPLTDARFMVPREDIAWENDRIAYRIYGPALAKTGVNNGIDVWTKRVRYPIVEKWYKGDEAADSNRISYHEDHGEGADFFSVGLTLGAGSCALYKNDSLYQPGVFTSHRILATGPIRAMFEVTYTSVLFDGKNISEIKRITLDAGINLNKVEVMYRCDSSQQAISFAAGIVKRKGVTSYADIENRWVSLWGATNDKEENGSLGTGIVMTKGIYTGIREDSVHVLVLGTIEPGKTATYYTGAGWTRSGDFSNADDWNDYLKEFSCRISFPLKIALKILK